MNTVLLSVRPLPLLVSLVALGFCATACSSSQKAQRSAETASAGGKTEGSKETGSKKTGSKKTGSKKTGSKETAGDSCRAWVLYSYEGQILRDSIVPPRYGWVEIRFDEKVTTTHGEGLWFWRDGRLANLDGYTKRVIREDGTHERSHRLVHNTLTGESTVVYDQPVRDDGYDRGMTAAEWASDEYDPFPPTHRYRGPKFAVVSVDERRVGLVLYVDQHISSAKHTAVDFEGNAVDFPGQPQPQWEDTTPPVEVAEASNQCGEVRIVDGQLHARGADSEASVLIERPTSTEPIRQLIAVQWLAEGEEVPRADIEEAPHARGAKSTSLLTEARQAVADGQTKRARALLADALLIDGDNPQVLFEYGTLALEAGQLDAAQHALVGAYDHSRLRSNEESKNFRARLLHHLGLLAEAQKDVDGAKDMYQRSLELRPDDDVRARLGALD